VCVCVCVCERAAPLGVTPISQHATLTVP